MSLLRMRRGYHEAGHAVAGVILGAEIVNVWISDDDADIGGVTLKWPAGQPGPWQDALVARSPVACMKAFDAHDPGDEGPLADEAKILTALEELSPGEEIQQDRLRDRLDAEADHLFEQEGVRSAAAALAHILYTEAAIAGDAAQHLIEAYLSRARGQR